MKRINYDVSKYNFSSILEEWFDCDDLSLIHHKKKYKDIFTREKDQSTIWHKIFYTNINKYKEFLYLYYNFLYEYIKPRYKDKIVFQSIPTFRVHLPDNLSVGEFHKDKDYRNEEWAKKIKELNYYLPFTDTNSINTIWAESKEDKKDFNPMVLKYGECMEWDGLNLCHGNKINTSKYTRVSVDFRVMSIQDYVGSDFTTINTKVKFNVGGYYSIL